ncbi:hypothetical protein H0E84_08985 [Luteimonas sp. SJ-92]|uniref:Tetratricopeptide repeat protein n=1 Tax=Luteimonas salinisoli TaxID=2752307 RepID=A0A853JD22_9GAMM|nr:hypothetical protein [Luteimonas salinisoli]NZA26519.1 hypothetical protein [Luteimonas salinisoli]
MGRQLVWAGVLLIVAAFCSGEAVAQQQGDTYYRQRIAEAWSAAQSGADARADQLFEALIGDPAFQRLPVHDRRRALSAAAWSAARNGRPEAAAGLYLRVADLDSDDPDDWYRMALVALELQDLDAAARAMTTMIGRWPELLGNISADVLYPLAQQGDLNTPDRIAYLQALFDANWKGGSAGAPGGIWLSLARTHLQEGDLVRARIVARRITGPNTLIAMRADRQFDTLLDRDGWRANIQHATAKEIERVRKLVDSYPDQLEPMVTLGHMLLLGGHHEETVALSDAALDRIASAPLDAPPFSDLHQQVWLMNHKSIALRRMGRLDEAVEELRRASRLGENGGTNISQALNLGSLECDRGNPRQALAAAALAGEEAMSDYGRAVRAAIHHCAALQIEDADMAMFALQELSGLRKEAPLLYLHVLLQADKADDAAALLPDLLASDDHRTTILVWAQDCRKPPPLPAQAGQRARKRAFLARQDVLDAIQAVGRIESYEVYCHMLG